MKKVKQIAKIENLFLILINQLDFIDYNFEQDSYNTKY